LKANLQSEVAALGIHPDSLDSFVDVIRWC
jgi:hypothetical protein